MKKTLIAMAVLGAASGFAMAASNVTLYGKIDTGIGIEKAKDGSAKITEATGKMSGSRWGIKGVEDLGNGYSVGFVLEQGFNSDNGASKSTRQFHRESQMYVQGDFGKVGFGRFGGLSSDCGSYSILTGWQFGTSYSDTGSIGKFAKLSDRMNNSVVYVAPAVGGVTVSAMYSNDAIDADDAEKWSKNTHYYGLGAKAAWGAFNGSAIFEVYDNKADKATSGEAEPAYAITLGGNQNFEAFTLSGIYQYAWQDDEYKQHAAGVSAAIPLAGGKAKLGVKGVMGEDETVVSGEDKYRAWSVNAAYEYPLSKRTIVYGYAGYASGDKLYNNETSKKDFGLNGYAIYAGLVHNF